MSGNIEYLNQEEQLQDYAKQEIRYEPAEGLTKRKFVIWRPDKKNITECHE